MRLLAYPIAMFVRARVRPVRDDLQRHGRLPSANVLAVSVTESTAPSTPCRVPGTDRRRRRFDIDVDDRENARALNRLISAWLAGAAIGVHDHDRHVPHVGGRGVAENRELQRSGAMKMIEKMRGSWRSSRTSFHIM